MTRGSFDRFTQQARQALTYAQDEARRFGHNYIGTEHLLLGLLRESDNDAAKVFEHACVRIEQVRNAVETIIGRGEREVRGAIGLTPRSKKVIELAVDEARRLNNHSIGAQHLLLGMIREGEGIAAGVLERLGLTLGKARAAAAELGEPRNTGTHAAHFGGREALEPTRDSSEPSAAMMRLGYGYDIHRLIPNRKLVLGGVTIEHPTGLEGHSDADVIVHAIIDALLGAAGLGDIGRMFPNSSPEWKETSSIHLLELTADKIANAGLHVVNVDVTLVAEEPKIGPHVDEMRVAISTALGISDQRINVKATTAEEVGPEGRKEAMSASAVALLVHI